MTEYRTSFLAKFPELYSAKGESYSNRVDLERFSFSNAPFPLALVALVTDFTSFKSQKLLRERREKAKRRVHVLAKQARRGERETSARSRICCCWGVGRIILYPKKVSFRHSPTTRIDQIQSNTTGQLQHCCFPFLSSSTTATAASTDATSAYPKRHPSIFPISTH